MPKRIARWNPARDVWEDEKGGTSLFCGHSDVYSGTFPGSGMTRNGVAYELRTWEHRTGDTGSSSSPDDETDALLRTPRTAEDEGGPRHPDVAKDRGQTLRLTGQILAMPGDLLPTPRASDGPNGGPGMRGSKGDLPLPAAVCQLLPTPQANIADNGGSQDPVKRRAGGHSVSIQDVAEHELMPTPAAGVFNDGESVEQWDARRARVKATGVNGNGMGETLSITVRRDDVFGRFAPTIRRWEQVLGRPAPPPTEYTGKGGAARLSPRFVEWMMGLPDGWVTDITIPRPTKTPLARGSDPEQAGISISRSQQLKALGNGVVPQQGAAAITDMLDAFERTPKETT